MDCLNAKTEQTAVKLCSGGFFEHAKRQIKADISLVKGIWGLRHRTASFSGQGTTEYAILVGVLVVIAILAITVFRPKIQELWDAISSGINGL